MLISIITITRNDLSGLLRTATSVRSQVGVDVEWIIVDGGSCASSHRLAETLRQEGCLHTVLREADRGPYDAMTKVPSLHMGK